MSAYTTRKRLACRMQILVCVWRFNKCLSVSLAAHLLFWNTTSSLVSLFQNFLGVNLSFNMDISYFGQVILGCEIVFILIIIK